MSGTVIQVSTEKPVIHGESHEIPPHEDYASYAARKLAETIDREILDRYLHEYLSIPRINERKDPQS